MLVEPRAIPSVARIITTSIAMEAPDTTDRLWDAKDVARYLSVSRSWVYQRAEDGTLPCLRIGALLRFDPAAIQAAIRAYAHQRGR
jgi:excisionase family DNA binding protein